MSRIIFERVGKGNVRWGEGGKCKINRDELRGNGGEPKIIDFEQTFFLNIPELDFLCILMKTIFENPHFHEVVLVK